MWWMERETKSISPQYYSYFYIAIFYRPIMSTNFPVKVDDLKLLFKNGLFLIIKRLSFSTNMDILFSLVIKLKLSRDGELQQNNN